MVCDRICLRRWWIRARPVLVNWRRGELLCSRCSAHEFPRGKIEVVAAGNKTLSSKKGSVLCIYEYKMTKNFFTTLCVFIEKCFSLLNRFLKSIGWFCQNNTYRIERSRIHFFKGTPGYKNKLILNDYQWLVKTNGATFIFIGKLGNKFLPGQFRPCLFFASLSVPSVP